MSWLKRTAFLSMAMLVLALAAHASDGACCSEKPGSTSAASCCAAGGDAKPESTAKASCCAKDVAADPHADHAPAPSESTDAHAAQTQGQHGRMGGHGGGQGGGMRAVMPDAMQLLHNHGALTRTVEELPNGVRTVNTTSDPAVLDLLRRHPRDMYNFYESGGAVRPHDPMFAELSRVADKVSMEFKNIENGIEVIATSEDPEVVKLLIAHANKVSEFVSRGMPALHEGAPLPEDYRPAK